MQAGFSRPANGNLTALRRELHGIAMALVLVLATTVVALVLRQYLGILRGAVLYLVPVMIAGYQYGVIPAMAAAVAGVLMSGYVYFAQLYRFKVAEPQEILNLVLFWSSPSLCRISPPRPSATPRSRASANAR